MVIVVYSRSQHYYAPQNKFHSHCMSFKFSHDSLHPSFSGQTFGYTLHTDFCHRQCSPKIVLTKQAFMSTAIRHTLTWRFWNMFSTARQFSVQTASDGRSSRGSNSRLPLPWQKLATQYLTMAYDGTSSLYALCNVTRLCICCSWTFPSVKNSSTYSDSEFCYNVVLRNQLYSIHCMLWSKQADDVQFLQSSNRSL